MIELKQAHFPVVGEGDYDIVLYTLLQKIKSSLDIASKRTILLLRTAKKKKARIVYIAILFYRPLFFLVFLILLVFFPILSCSSAN